MLSMQKKIGIIGNGISALTTCFWINHFHPNHEVHLYKGKNEAGGWMKSISTNCDNIFDVGPNSFRFVPHLSKCVLYAIDRIGLTSELVPHRSQKRYLYLGDAIYDVSSFKSLISNFGGKLHRPLLIAAIKNHFTSLRLQRNSLRDDRSVFEVISEELGSDIAQYLVDPICRGIYGTDCSNLSQRVFRLNDRIRNSQSLMKSCFVFKDEKSEKLSSSQEEEDAFLTQTFKDYLDNRIKLFCLKKGMQSFCTSMLQYLKCMPNIRIFDERCGGLIPSIDNNKLLYISNSINTRYDSIISTISASDLNNLLPDDQNSFLNLKKVLKSVKYTSLEVLNVIFDDLKCSVDMQNAFGYLVPKIVDEHLMGAIFHDQLVAAASIGQRKFTVITGHREDIENTPESIQSKLVRHLGIRTFRDYRLVAKNVLHDAIPCFQPGYESLVEEIEDEVKEFENFSINSTFLNGISLNDCCNSSYELSKTIP